MKQSRLVRNLFIAVLILAVTFPFIWIVITSFKLPRDIMSSRILSDPTLRNYIELFRMEEFIAYLRNSAVIALGSTIIGVTVATLASYGVSRYKYRLGLGRIVLGFLLFTRMIFPMALAIPFYSLVNMIGLYDTIWAVMFVQTSINIPFAVWMLRSAFIEFPVSLEESAKLDGASTLRILLQIVLPLVKPAIAAAAIFTFMLSWNDYLFAVTLTATPNAATIPVGLAKFVQENVTRWGMMSAGATVFSLPIFALAYSVQGRLIRGFTAGTVKG